MLDCPYYDDYPAGWGIDNCDQDEDFGACCANCPTTSGLGDWATWMYKTEAQHAVASPGMATGVVDGPFYIPGVNVLRMKKGVPTRPIQLSNYTDQHGCLKWNNVSGKAERDADCCVPWSDAWVGCEAGFDLKPSTPMDHCTCSGGSDQCRKTTCTPSRQTHLHSVIYSLPSLAGGPFEWKLQGNLKKKHKIWALDAKGNVLLELKTNETVGGNPYNLVLQSMLAAESPAVDYGVCVCVCVQKCLCLRMCQRCSVP